MEAFINLAEKKPLSKITVKDIVDECGINRNTFYYHFQDIYALVEEYFLLGGEHILKSVGEGKDWATVFTEYAEELVKDRSILLNFYKNIGRDQTLKYMFIMAENFIGRIINSYPEADQASAKDKEAIICFYSNAYCGLVMKWIDEGMKEEPKSLVLRCEKLFVSSLHSSIKAAANLKNH